MYVCVCGCMSSPHLNRDSSIQIGNYLGFDRHSHAKQISMNFGALAQALPNLAMFNVPVTKHL